jgi:hypothetical protein
MWTLFAIAAGLSIAFALAAWYQQRNPLKT